MGTKNKPGQFDCYANAAPDEPMFVLLARDRHAPVLVKLWALLRERSNEDEQVIAEALGCAKAMETWAHKQGRPLLSAEGAHLAQRLFVEATEGLAEHPDGFDESCDCNLCRSYAAS